MLFKANLLATVVSAALTVGGAAAGPLTELADQAEKRAAAGDVTAALGLANDLLGQVWDQSSDIGIRDSLLVGEPAAGYGLYNPRGDDKFKAGEPVYVYAEPFGFGYGTPEDGLYAIGFAVDLRVISSSGEVMASVADIATLDLTSRYKNREFQANLTYTLDGIPAGRYVLETTLRDKNSAKTGSFQTEVEFVE